MLPLRCLSRISNGPGPKENSQSSSKPAQSTSPPPIPPTLVLDGKLVIRMLKLEPLKAS